MWDELSDDEKRMWCNEPATCAFVEWLRGELIAADEQLVLAAGDTEINIEALRKLCGFRDGIEATITYMMRNA